MLAIYSCVLRAASPSCVVLLLLMLLVLVVVVVVRNVKMTWSSKDVRERREGRGGEAGAGRISVKRSLERVRA